MATRTLLERKIVNRGQYDRTERALRGSIALLFGKGKKVRNISYSDTGLIRGFWNDKFGQEHSIEGKIINDRFVWRAKLECGKYGRWRDGKYDEILLVDEIGYVEMDGE